MGGGVSEGVQGQRGQAAEATGGFHSVEKRKGAQKREGKKHNN